MLVHDFSKGVLAVFDENYNIVLSFKLVLDQPYFQFLEKLYISSPCKESKTAGSYPCGK